MFIVEQKELLKAVKITAEAIRTKTLLEACYMDITFTYRKSYGDIKLFASCGDISIAYYLEPYEIKQEFESYRVNYKKLINCVNSFDKDCRLSLQTEDGKLKISEYTNRKLSYSNLICNDLYSYPEIELLSNKATDTLQYYTDEKDLKELIKSSLFAIADKSDVRKCLHGGLFEFENKFFRVITANGRMCCIVGEKGDKVLKTEKFESCILPEETLIRLEKLLKDREKTVSIYWKKEESGNINKIEFMFDNIVLQSTLISDTFPNWRQMQLNEGCYNYKLFVDKKEMQKICEKHLKFFKGILDEKPKEALDITNFEVIINTEKILIKSEDYNKQSSIVDDINIDEIINKHRVIDNIINIKLDVNYLTQAIKSINHNNIYIKILNEINPIEIVGESPNKFTCILMPIRVKN